MSRLKVRLVDRWSCSEQHLRRFYSSRPHSAPIWIFSHWFCLVQWTQHATICRQFTPTGNPVRQRKVLMILHHSFPTQACSEYVVVLRFYLEQKFTGNMKYFVFDSKNGESLMNLWSVIWFSMFYKYWSMKQVINHITNPLEQNK